MLWVLNRVKSLIKKSFLFHLQSYFKKRSAFSLLEVMIALMIISLTVVTLSGVESIAIKSNRKTIIYTRATILANRLMSEIELKVSNFGFAYLETLEKKTESTIDEKTYKGWKWTQEIKEISFPIGNLMQSMIGTNNFDSKEESSSNDSNKNLDAGMLNVLMMNLEQLISSSMRQVVITVYWPVKAGKSFGHMKLIYYPIDFSVVESYVPGF